MDPIVIVVHLGSASRPIGSYGLMLVLAILVGALLSLRAATRARLDAGASIAAIATTIGAAGLGAYVLFFLVEWARTGAAWSAIEQPGLVFYGAPLGGAVGLHVATRRLGLPLGRLLDVVTPALPAAHAVGRIGCFLGGCCYGRPFDGLLAVTYLHPLAPAAHPPLARHPVPLYEAAFLLGLSLCLALVPLGEARRGRRFLVYVLAYALARLLLEALRGDAVRGSWLGVSPSQALSLAIAAPAAWLLLSRSRARGAPAA